MAELSFIIVLGPLQNTYMENSLPDLALITVRLRQCLDSVAINQQITHLPLSSSLYPQDTDSLSINQRAACIITHLGPPLFLISTFDKCCLFPTLIASSFHHNLMFVSCRFLGYGCGLESYNFSIKETVMGDEQVEQTQERGFSPLNSPGR